ncbi:MULTISPECIES: peptidoglycan-binding domain-containing protein [Lysobacter]|uniref:Peptidoglycan-binding domain-containing protein n=1 Tax=Lysobacter firmicutimachus TaxID=1792846 RepID=A0ABU8D9Q3_9GAMM|nr:peptidoglycan-binding domain-containing protein [Lysobacter antibioticus]
MALQDQSYVQRELEFPGALSQGASGAATKRVQEWLGYHGNGTPVDGKFGPATGRALAEFARRKQLGFSGVLDEALWEALIEPLARIVALPAVAPSKPYAQAVRWFAEQHLAAHPIELGGANRGPWVRLYMKGSQGDAMLWCAGFVSFVLRQAAEALGGAPPIAGSFGCDELAAQAKQVGRFVAGRSVTGGRDIAAPGGCGIFLVRKTASDWIHTGFAFDGDRDSFLSIEGNTDRKGSSNGFEVARRSRRTSANDFIRLH